LQINGAINRQVEQIDHMTLSLDSNDYMSYSMMDSEVESSMQPQYPQAVPGGGLAGQDKGTHQGQ